MKLFSSLFYVSKPKKCLMTTKKILFWKRFFDWTNDFFLIFLHFLKLCSIFNWIKRVFQRKNWVGSTTTRFLIEAFFWKSRKRHKVRAVKGFVTTFLDFFEFRAFLPETRQKKGKFNREKINFEVHWLWIRNFYALFRKYCWNVDNLFIFHSIEKLNSLKFPQCFELNKFQWNLNILVIIERRCCPIRLSCRFSYIGCSLSA